MPLPTVDAHGEVGVAILGGLRTLVGGTGGGKARVDVIIA